MLNEYEIGMFVKLQTENAELTHEGLTDMLGFFGSFTTSIGMLWNKIMNNHVYAIEHKPMFDKSAFNQVAVRGIAGMEKFQVYRPQRMSSFMYDIVVEIESHMQLMSDMETRLYDPVIEYLAKASSWDEAMSKPWLDRDLKFNDVDDFKKRISKFYQDKDDVKETKNFSEVYAKIAHVETVYKVLNDCYNYSDKINLVSLRAKEQRIVELINFLIKTKGESLNSEMIDANRKRLMQALRSIAEETEYLVVIIYELNRLITANNSNFKRFNEELS